MMKSLLCGLVFVLLWAVPVKAQDAEPGYQEALRRIEAARVSGEAFLDLANLGLESLPPEIGQLTELDTLFVPQNQLTSLPEEMRHLTALRSLFLAHNRFTTVPAVIIQIPQLETLEVAMNQITALPPEIGQMSTLSTIYAAGNQITHLPPEIGQLSNLVWLDVAGNPLVSLPPEMGQLTNLQALYVNGTPLTTLPLELGRLPKLNYFAATSLTFPPVDVQQQGIPAMLAYLRDYEAVLMRQMIVGIAGGVGAIAGVILAFRWRQRRGFGEKKKRL